MAEQEEDDPKNFSVPAPGGFFFAGWIIEIIIALVATAGLVLARDLWLGQKKTIRKTSVCLRPADFSLPAGSLQSSSRWSPPPASCSRGIYGSARRRRSEKLQCACARRIFLCRLDHCNHHRAGRHRRPRARAGSMAR